MRIFLLVLLAVLSSCTPVGEQTELEFKDKSNIPTDNFQSAMQVMNDNCMSCHDTNSGRAFTLSNNSKAQDFIDQGMIVPGKSAESLLVQRMKFSNGIDANMPMQNTRFSKSDYNRVVKWIDSLPVVNIPKPQITIQSPSANSSFKNTVVIKGTCTSNLNIEITLGNTSQGTVGCINQQFETTQTLSGTDGAKVIKLSQTNEIGEISEASITLIKDNVAPVIEVIQPLANAIVYENSVQLTGNCEASLNLQITFAQVQRSIVCPDNGRFTDSLTGINTDGEKPIRLQQTDRAGNSTTLNTSFVKATRAAEAPVIKISSPMSGTSFQQSVTVAGSCEANIQVVVSGDVAANSSFTCPANGQYSRALTLNAPDGLKNLTLQQTKNAIAAQASLSVYRDTVKPTLAITSPANLSFTRASLTVSGNCEVGIPVVLSATGLANVNVTCTQGQFSRALVLNSADGIKAISVTQTDAAQNATTSTISVTLDTTPPLITLSAPMANLNTIATSVIVAGTCESNLLVRISQSTSSTSVNCTNSAFSTSLTLSPGLGDKNISVTQTDQAGNTFEQLVKITRIADSNNYASSAHEVLKNRCIGCHAVGWETQLNNVSDLQQLVSLQKIIPGDPEKSPVIQRMYFGPNHSNSAVSKMPPVASQEYQGFNIHEYQAVYNYITSIKPAPGSGGNDTPFVCNTNAEASLNPLKRLTKIQYTNTLRDLLKLSFTTTVVDSIMSNLAVPLSTIPDDESKHDFPGLDNQVTSAHITGQLDVAVSFAQEVTSSSTRLNTFVGESCAQTYSDVNCRNRFIDRFGPIVLRHPLSPEQRDKFRTDAAALSSYADLIAVFLMESDFLYHTEFGGTPVGGNESQLKLTPHELANRISYLFFQSMPDSELRTAADSGTITTQFDTVVNAAYTRAQTKTFSLSNTTRNGFGHFMSGWLQLDEIPTMQSLNASSLNATLGITYPSKNTALPSNMDLSAYRSELVQEMMDMFNYYSYEGNGDLYDLLTSNVSFAKGQNLAKAYGVAAWNGNTSNLITFPSTERSGILTRAGFHFHAGILSRPILKGVKIMKKVLCEDIQAPANNTAPEGVVIEADFTVREKTHALTQIEGTSCVSCHQRINPLGFATEDYDVFGRHRSVEHIIDYAAGSTVAVKPVDSSAIPQITLTDTTSVSGGVQLSKIIADSGKADACIVRNFHKFTYRQKENLSKDACSLEFMYREHKTGGLKGMMTGIVRAPAFSVRNHDGED